MNKKIENLLTAFFASMTMSIIIIGIGILLDISFITSIGIGLVIGVIIVAIYCYKRDRE